MPGSLHIAANFFKRETFLVWDSATQQFGPVSFVGRKKRIDAFVSLWHRSSRREHIYVKPDLDYANIIAVQHVTSGVPYLISGTVESDSWQADDNVYDVLLRCHKVSGPSGGVAQWYPVQVLGTGDDLGPVQIGPPVAGFADSELRSTSDLNDSVQSAIAEYYLAYSSNLTPVEGDYITLQNNTYRIMETNVDSGYSYARVKQEPPRFETAEFKLPSSTPAKFDPATGKMSAGTEITRQVSVLVDARSRTGKLPQHQISETLEVYVYLAHIGFTPLLGHGVVLDGVRYTVDRVTRSLENKQWKLEVSR